MELPGLVGESDILLAPIVSSGKAARLICQSWQRHHGRLPDFVVVEGCEAGGHLGFEPQELESGTALPLERIGAPSGAGIAGLCHAGTPHPGLCRRRDLYTGRRPAGGDGMPGPTAYRWPPAWWPRRSAMRRKPTNRPICWPGPRDIVLVKSPVGMPGACLALAAGGAARKGRGSGTAWAALRACDQKNAPYCIAQALIRAAQGDWENGLFFCGSNAWRLERMEPVQQVIQQIMGEG